MTSRFLNGNQRRLNIDSGLFVLLKECSNFCFSELN